MNINKIVIACFKNDLYLLRACIGSIRYWYPDIEIYLLKDYSKGDFSTKEMEQCFGVKVFQTEMSLFGWGFAKLAILLKAERDKYLFLDSDIVLLGDVIKYLNSQEGDFIVTGILEENKYSNQVKSHYLDVEKLHESLDPDYEYMGFCFNSGQIVMTSGLIKKNHLEKVISLENPITNKYPEIFKYGDQGALNYVFNKCHSQSTINLKYADFWIWPGSEEVKYIDLNDIKNFKGIPKVLHWAGLKPVDHQKMLRYDIFNFYEKYYYQNIKHGNIKYFFRKISLNFISFIKIISYKIRGLSYSK